MLQNLNTTVHIFKQKLLIFETKTQITNYASS